MLERFVCFSLNHDLRPLETLTYKRTYFVNKKNKQLEKHVKKKIKKGAQ